MTPDPKPVARRRDPGLMRMLHAQRNKQCVLCDRTEHIELHHVLPRSQSGDDVRANLVFLCHEHHEFITHGNELNRHLLGEFLMAERPDTLAYLASKGAAGWAERQLFIDISWLARRPS